MRIEGKKGSESQDLQASPNVVVDARFLTGQPSGFYVYLSGLIEGMRQLRTLRPLAYRLTFLNRHHENPVFSGFEQRVCPIPFLSLRELSQLHQYLDPATDQLFYSPTFMSVPFLPIPWIQTVHDLNHLHFGSLDKKLYYQFLLKPFCRKARVLTSVSDFSRGEIARWLQVSSSTIGLIPNSLDPDLWSARGKFELGDVVKEGRYVFLLSGDKPHKNYSVVRKAFRRFYEANPGRRDFKLICSFDPPPEWEDREGVLFRSHLPKKLDRHELAQLLRGAAAVLAPSLYEGFGLPPVEAVASGTPVILSSIPPHQEGLSGVPPGEVTWLQANDGGAWQVAIAQAEKGALPRIQEATSLAVREKWSRLKSAEALDCVILSALGAGSCAVP